MFASSRRFAALALVAAAPAFAAPVTLTFKGTVTSNEINATATGQTVSGSLTLDPSTFYQSGGDGTSWQINYGYFYSAGACSACVQQTNPLQIGGKVVDDSTQVAVGGGSYYDHGYQDVFRNAGDDNVYNRALWAGTSYNLTGEYSVILLSVSDYLGVNTQIFSDAMGGMATNQGINWMAPGSTARFMIRSTFGSNVGDWVNQSGTLTSVMASYSVPEPASQALVASALLLAGAASRRRFTKR